MQRRSRNRILLVVVLVLLIEIHKSRTKDGDENEKCAQAAKILRDRSMDPFMGYRSSPTRDKKSVRKRAHSKAPGAVTLYFHPE